jgi:SAM-dependent methyltransferase
MPEKQQEPAMEGLAQKVARPLKRLLKSPTLRPLRDQAKKSRLLRDAYLGLRVRRLRADYRHRSPPIFTLEAPVCRQTSSICHFSGWYLPPENHPPVNLAVVVEGTPVASLVYGVKRFDIARLFPGRADALASGFFGDILLGDELSPGQSLRIAIVDRGQSDRVLFEDQFILTSNADSLPHRTRSYDLNRLLSKQPPPTDCTTYRCGDAIQVLSGDELPMLRIAQRETTHPYCEDAQRIVAEHADGVVLDFGAGNTPAEFIRPNVCYLDVHQYPYTDVVCTTPWLPFADNSFDAIISQAVFEHIPDPFGTAREFYRILKPGGIVHLDTAFMQPLHGDPSHFFNMTQHALRLVFADFQELRSGSKWYQNPSYGLLMSLEAVLPHLAAGAWRRRLVRLERALKKRGARLDQDLGPTGREILAAGVFFEGRKRLAA